MILDKLEITTQIILSLSIIYFCGFLSTRITKRLKLPYVTGYIVMGIILGPYGLKIIPENIRLGMDFITDIALPLIAFDVGKYLKLSVLKETRRGVIIMTLFESLLTATLVTLALYYVFKLDLTFSLLLGTIASATAPTSTMMTIRQYQARGPFVNMVLQVIALDIALSLISFSVVAAIITAMHGSGSLSFQDILLPIATNLAAILVGIGAGIILKALISQRRTSDNRLILSIAVLFAVSGFCSYVKVSPLLASMALGTTYANISKRPIVFEQLSSFSPPILLLFFVLSGMRLNISSLGQAGLIGIGYFGFRIIGKIIGSYIGGTVGKAPVEIRRYFGFALLPQASVAIGLALLGQRLINDANLKSQLTTIVLSSALLFEMIGPALAKLSLFLSKSIPHDSPELTK